MVLTDIFVSKYAEHNSLYQGLVVEVFGYLEKENITFFIVFFMLYTKNMHTATSQALKTFKFEQIYFNNIF